MKTTNPKKVFVRLIMSVLAIVLMSVCVSSSSNAVSDDYYLTYLLSPGYSKEVKFEKEGTYSGLKSLYFTIAPKKVGSTVIYSSWSTVKAVKIK